MMDFILAIPDEIGWSIVGATAMLLVVVVVKSVKEAVVMYREYRENAGECNAIDD